jgi:hypothetical protein
MLNPRNFTSLLVDKTIQAHEDDLINHSLLIYWEDSKTYKDNYSYSFHNIYIYIYIYVYLGVLALTFGVTFCFPMQTQIPLGAQTLIQGQFLINKTHDITMAMNDFC